MAPISAIPETGQRRNGHLAEHGRRVTEIRSRITVVTGVGLIDNFECEMFNCECEIMFNYVE